MFRLLYCIKKTKKNLKHNKLIAKKWNAFTRIQHSNWCWYGKLFQMENVGKLFWKCNNFSRIFIFDFRYFNFSGSFPFTDAISVFHNPNDSIVFSHTSYFLNGLLFSSSFVLFVEYFPLVYIFWIWWMTNGGHNWIHWTRKIIASALFIPFDRGF